MLVMVMTFNRVIIGANLRLSQAVFISDRCI